MAKSVMPKSKAKTAYGLLSEIRKLILEEPKRYDQGDFIRTGSAATAAYGEDVPVCGTVCCVAGWVAVLKGGFTQYSKTAGDRTLWADDFAANVLFGHMGDSYTCPQANELFDGDAAGSRIHAPAHARRGAKHIERFQKKYAAQLKAKRV